MSEERLEITLHGQLFRLKAPVGEHEMLLKAANYVNEVMRELTSMTGGRTAADSATLALQAAFRISHEYFKSLENNDSKAVAENVEARLQAVNEMLRNALSTGTHSYVPTTELLEEEPHVEEPAPLPVEEVAEEEVVEEEVVAAKPPRAQKKTEQKLKYVADEHIDSQDDLLPFDMLGHETKFSRKRNRDI